MKNIIQKVFIFLLLIGVIGCENMDQQENLVLYLNPNEADQSLPLSTFVDSISYIPLETSDESILVRVSEIIIKDKFIYAVDMEQKVVFIFDKKGKFVSKLARQGEGPDEYLWMQQVLVDDEESYIEIFDYRGANSRIISYDINTLEPIGKQPLFIPSASAVRKERDKNMYYFAAQQQENTIAGEITNADIIAVDGNNTQKALFKKNIVTGGSFFSPFSESFATNEQGDILVSLMYNTTFYRLSDMEAYPVMTVDFGKCSMDPSIGLKSAKEQRDYLYGENSAEGLAFFPILNTYNSKILAISYNFKENSNIHAHHYIDLKSKDRIYHVRDIINDLTGFPDKIYVSSGSYAINHEVYQDGYLVDILLPAYHLKDKAVEIPGIGMVDREDNPIIVFMKIKDQ